MTRMFAKKTSAHGLSRIRCAQMENHENIMKLKRWDNWDNMRYNSNTTKYIYIKYTFVLLPAVRLGLKCLRPLYCAPLHGKTLPIGRGK